MRKWITTALVLVVLLSMLLTGCAPKATPTPTPTPKPMAPRTPTAPPPSPAAPQAGATRVLEPAGIVMVYVPAAEFPMGSSNQEVDDALQLCEEYREDCERLALENEQPRHTVRVDGVWIGRTEVTNAQFRQFIEAGGYSDETYWSDDGWSWKESEAITEPKYGDDERLNQPQQPVVGVSWYEAEAFAAWAGGRLPTEAEWEHAARGSAGHIFPWGSEWDGTRCNFCDSKCPRDWKDDTVDDGYEYAAPVGSYPSGASPYGALDMAGNVWEWVAD